MKLMALLEYNALALEVWDNNLFIGEYRFLDKPVCLDNGNITSENFEQIQVDIKTCIVINSFHEDRFIGKCNDQLMFQSSHNRTDLECFIYEEQKKILIPTKYYLNIQRLVDRDNCLYFTNDDNTFKIYNPISEDIIWEKQGSVGFWLALENDIIMSNKSLLSSYTLLTSEVKWQTDLSAFKVSFTGSDYIIVGVKYNEKTKQLIVSLQNGILLGINAETGILKWYIEKSHSRGYIIDPSSGNIFYKGSYEDKSIHNKDYKDGVVLSILDTNGLCIKTVRLTDEQLKIKAYCATQNTPFEGISAREALLGIYGDYLYFAVDIYPLLYKVNKHTLAIEAVYEHDKPFYSPFIFIQNKLIISDLHSIYEDKNRLLVFELEG